MDQHDTYFGGIRYIKLFLTKIIFQKVHDVNILINVHIYTNVSDSNTQMLQKFKYMKHYILTVSKKMLESKSRFTTPKKYIYT